MTFVVFKCFCVALELQKHEVDENRENFNSAVLGCTQYAEQVILWLKKTFDQSNNAFNQRFTIRYNEVTDKILPTHGFVLAKGSERKPL